MSRAFVKEDVDPPERSGRARSASGLPPGALNYITAGGAARLRAELDVMRRNGDSARCSELERVLGSVTIVQRPTESDSIAFGARVTLRDATGTYSRGLLVLAAALMIETVIVISLRLPKRDPGVTAL
jgi:hypothetical protein